MTMGPRRYLASLAIVFLLFPTGCAEEAPPPEEVARPEEAAEREEAARAEEAADPDPATAAPGPTDPAEVDFAPELQVDLDAMERRESGLYVQVLEEGEGPRAAPGDSMRVHYTVWFPDGRKLDSSHDHEPAAPLPMALGETALIEGWTEGVTGMREGERRRLVVPYGLAYGVEGRPPQVPPYSTLVFEVELVEHTPAGS